MTDDLHVPVTSAEFSIIQVNMTKTKYNNVIYYCICLSNVIKDWKLIVRAQSFFKPQKRFYIDNMRG